MGKSAGEGERHQGQQRRREQARLERLQLGLLVVVDDRLDRGVVEARLPNGDSELFGRDEIDPAARCDADLRR